MKRSDLPERFKEFIKKEELIRPGQKVIVGLSGGADSVCLFNLLSDISEEYDLTILPVHVNHGIRGKEADRDENFAKSICEKKGTDFIACSIDAPAFASEHSLTLEEAARFLRYEVLEAVARDEDADSIALAHHMDDQAETVLMNLFRGSGATGLSGIRPRQGMRIRPLLFATKKEILLYLKENKTRFVEDSTNFSKDHTRNRMRLELLPLIEELYPRAKSHIASAAEDVGVWRDYIEKEAKQIRGGIKGKDKRPNHGDNELKDSVLIDRQAFLKNPRAIREEWLRQAVAEVIPARKDVTRDHYLGIIDLLESEVTGRRIDLPRGCCAVRTYDGVVIGQKSATLPDSSDEKTETESFQRALEIPGTVKGPEDTENTYFVTELFDANIFNEEIDIFSEEKDYTKYIDYDKIEVGLVLRHPRKGDYFIMDGSGKKKKLSRYFIDQKVPKEQRSKELVIADGLHIVWALPDRLSEHYKVTENTTRVLKISRECEGVPVGMEDRMKEEIVERIKEDDILNRIRELAEELNRDYEGKKLHLACVLKGGVYFVCELSKYLTMPVTIDFMSLSSYGDGMTSQGVITLNQDLTQDIAGKHVLLVEDIIDSGRTLFYVENMLKKREPASFEVCALLDKKCKREADVDIKYVGFEIEDYFAVGFGLDYAQKYRNLRYIGELQFKED